MKVFSKNPFRKFALGILWTIVGLMVVSFFVNSTVNPLWVSPSPWSDEGFADYKPIHKQPRTGKAGIAAQGNWDALVVGSSRLDIAIDSTDPLWNGARVANLSLRGGNLCEFAPLVSYAIERNPIRTLVLGVDHYDLTSPVGIVDPASFAQSPLAENGFQLEQTIRDYIGGSTTTYSIKAINYRAKGRLASYNRFGQWAHSLDGRPFRSIFLTDSFPQVLTWMDRAKRHPGVNPEKVEALNSILTLCAERQVRVVIIIPPNHGAYLAAFFEGPFDDPTFSLNRATLIDTVERHNTEHPESDAVEVWDFCDFHPINCEPIPAPGEIRPMERWIDGTHATVPVGSMMLQVALTDTPVTPAECETPYGQRIHSGNLDQRNTWLREGFERYRSERPEEMKWVKGLLDEALPDR